MFQSKQLILKVTKTKSKSQAVFRPSTQSCRQSSASSQILKSLKSFFCPTNWNLLLLATLKYFVVNQEILHTSETNLAPLCVLWTESTVWKILCITLALLMSQSTFSPMHHWSTPLWHQTAFCAYFQLKLFKQKEGCCIFKE